MVSSGFAILRYLPRIGILSLLLLSAPVVPAQMAEVSGTLPEDYLPGLREILVKALTQSPQTLEGHFMVEVRSANRLAADSNRLPNLSAHINYGYRQEAISSQNDSSSRDQGLNYHLGLNQPVFHWGALKNQSDIARINVLLAEKNLARAYRELCVLLRRLYMDLIVEKVRVRHSRESLRLVEQSVRVAKERLTLGQASAADVAGEEFRLSETSYANQRAEDSFLADRQRFSRLAGIPLLAEEAVPDEIPPPVLPNDLLAALTAGLLRDGAKSTLEAEIHDLRAREALLRYNIERVRLLPKFSLGAAYSLQNNTNINANIVEQRAIAQQSISLGANWAIFDGFATRAAKREARASQRYVEQRREVELEALLQDAQILARQLRLDVRGLELAEARRAMAVEARRRLAEEVEFGNVGAGAVERAQVDISFAEANTLESRALLLDHWSAFVALAGEDPILNHVPARHVRPKK